MLKDVRNELISLSAARDDYGVVVEPQTWTVDATATQRLRASMRAARGWTEAPKVLWEDAPKRADAAA